MADILISQLPAGSPLLTDLLILANPTTGIAKKSTVTQLNNVLTLVGLSDVAQVTPPANSILEWDEGFTYITNVARASGVAVGFVPTFSALSPIELTSSNLKQTDYGFEISDDNYLNNASVLFGLSSNSKGFLMPRLATTDRTDIISPPKGLEVFDTTLNIPFYYNGTSWKGVQEVLISGTNLKTINNTSLLGSGNISTIQAWGSITGTLSNQTDLQNALNAKQATLISGTNIKTINGTTLLGSGDLVVASGITTLNTLTESTQSFAIGSSGTDFTISSVTSTHTFNLPTASASARGLLSSSNWTTFNNKVGGSGTANYLSKFTASGTIGNSLIYDNGTSIDIGTVTSQNGEILRIGNGKSIQLENTSATIQSINFYNQALSIGNGYGMKFFSNSGIQTGSITQEWLSSSKFGIIFKNYPGSLQEAMRIDGNNNILINRTTDDGSGAKLQMNGNVSIAGGGVPLKINGAPNPYISIYDTVNYVEVYLGVVHTLSPNYGRVGTANNNDFAIMTNNSPKLYVTKDGKILIGRTTDDGSGAQLQVNGGFSQTGANNINYFAGSILINTTTQLYGTDILTVNGNIRSLANIYSSSIATTDTIYSGKDLQTFNSGIVYIRSGANPCITVTTSNIGTGAHTTSGNHLPIIVNGVTYWLALLNKIV